MGNQPAYGDVVVRLEAAAVAIGRLDAALSGHPLLPAWTFWSQLDTARRHAEADGRRVDLYRLAAFLHGLPLRVGAPLSLAERGSDIAALAYAIELRSWTVQPNAEQQDLLDRGLTHLTQTGVGQSALIGAALGLRAWIARDGSRAAIRTALPFYLKERGITRQPLAPLTGSDALKPGAFEDAEGFTSRFLDAMTREADDARGLLATMEREWGSARMVVSRRLASRSTSRLPQAVDVLAASPLLSVSALARALGCTVEGASGMLDELARLEIVAEVTGMTGRGARRLYGLRRLVPIRAETTAARRRPRGGPRGRPRKILLPPFAELPLEGAPTGPADATLEAGKATSLAFDFEALDRLIATTDEQTRHVRRLLARVAAGEPSYPEPRSNGSSTGEE
jgi:hypothetical protein